MTKEIFKKEYSGEEICDVERDVIEAFNPDYNPAAGEVPVDKHGFQEGTFTITVTWEADNSSPDWLEAFDSLPSEMIDAFEVLQDFREELVLQNKQVADYKAYKESFND